jgi:hypothetical protein
MGWEEERGETHIDESVQTELGAVLTSEAQELATIRLSIDTTKALVPSMKDKVIMTIVPSEIGTLGEQIDDLSAVRGRGQRAGGGAKRAGKRMNL